MFWRPFSAVDISYHNFYITGQESRDRIHSQKCERWPAGIRDMGAELFYFDMMMILAIL